LFPGSVQKKLLSHFKIALEIILLFFVKSA
jgi:hypothetical protein